MPHILQKELPLAPCREPFLYQQNGTKLVGFKGGICTLKIVWKQCSASHVGTPLTGLGPNALG